MVSVDESSSKAAYLGCVGSVRPRDSGRGELLALETKT
jgi:hypothetical protein